MSPVVRLGMFLPRFKLGIPMPHIRTRLRRQGGDWSPAVLGLVDTGAGFTMAEMHLAGEMGIEPDVRAQPKETWVPASGSKEECWPFDLELGLGTAGDVQSLGTVRVRFTERPLPANILLGQLHTLDRVVLSHSPARPSLKLILP